MSNNNQKEIKLLLEKINLLFRIFEKEGVSTMSSLEKELLREQAQHLLAAIDNIKTGEKQAVATESAQPEVSINEKDILPEQEHIRSEVKQVPKVKEIPVKEPVVEVKPATPSVEANIPEITPPVVTPPTPPQPVAEEVELSINEKMAQVREGKAPVQVSGVKPRNMRDIIDLNKSFILKKDLFNNNNDTYNAFVNALNTTANENAALAIVKDYANKLGWDEEDKSYELISRAVEKRFLPIL